MVDMIGNAMERIKTHLCGIRHDSQLSFTDLSFFKSENCLSIPGLVDVHVHLREPGFSYKETIKTGTEAAAHGGYTAVCPMPNLNPVPDSKGTLDIQLELIKQNAVIKTVPYGTITKGEKGETLSDMEARSN